MKGLSSWENALDSGDKSADAKRMEPMSVVVYPMRAIAVGNHEVEVEKPFWTSKSPNRVRIKPTPGNRNLSFFIVWKLRI